MLKDTGLRAEETVFLSGLSGDIMRGEIEHRFRIIDFFKNKRGKPYSRNWLWPRGNYRRPRLYSRRTGLCLRR